jgi:capsular exopolysaccharide synthesis family protein
MEPQQLIAALRANWWLPLVGLIVGGATALAVSLMQTPLYTSSTQFLVTTTTSESTPSGQALPGNPQRAVAFAQLITGDGVAGRVVDRLGLDMSTQALQAEIEATPVEDTALVDVTVTDPSPERARDIADAVGPEVTAFVAELEAPQSGGVAPVELTVIDRPELPGAPTSPDTVRNVATGVVLGLLVGAVLAVARARPDRRVQNDEQAADLVGAPVLGHMVRDAALAKRHIIDGPGAGLAAENYRQLRNSLQWLEVDDPPSVIMVTSAVPSEGKTTTVVNLALVLADAGRKVAVVDADLRTSKITDYLGMAYGAGLSNVLSGTADLSAVVQRYDDREIWVIAAGPTPANPGELLATGEMRSLIDKLRGDYDYVLVDAPPVLSVADASGMARYTDGVLLVVRQGSTQVDELREAAAVLQRVRAMTLGVVLNMVPAKAVAKEGIIRGHTSPRPV